jgi:hypothetical protein
MSRLAVAGALASLLVACGACSKKPTETAKTTEEPLPQVIDKSAGDKPPTPDTGSGKTAGGTMSPANDTSYKLAVTTPPVGPAGADAIAHVTVTPAQGWHVNKDFPTTLQLKAPDGLTLTKPVQEAGDAAKLDDNELAFDIKMKAAKAGTYSIDGEIKFAVCTPETCDPKKQPVSIVMVAQ